MTMTSTTDDTQNPIFETVRSATCDIIVKDFQKYASYKYESKIGATLGQYCKNILQNEVINANTEIEVSNYKLARVYGITNVFILSIKSKNNKSAGLVVDATKINVASVHSDLYHNLSLQNKFLPELGGLNYEFEKVKRLMCINKMKCKLYRPHGILLHGPPGCGKTSFGKSVAKKFGALFYNVDSSNLLTSDYGSGGNNLKETFHKAKGLLVEGPVILFLDEVDMLCPRPERASLGNKQLSNALMAEMDKLHSANVSGLIILAATNSISSIDSGLRRPGRFDQEILINVPSESQRYSIFQTLMAGLSLSLSSDVSCKALAQMTPGFVGSDLRSLCEEAISHAQDHDSTIIGMSDFDSALHKTIPSLKKGSGCVVDLKPVHWSEIGSLEDIKMEVKQCLEWPLKHPDILANMDIPPTKGILLYGPPGCCKTTLVRAAATSCNVSFLSLSGAQVYSAYVGESEKLISQAFQKARALAPSILFFDEIESLVGKRNIEAGHSRVQERILSTMLNEMDGVGNNLDCKVDSSLATHQNQSQRQTDDENCFGTDSNDTSNEVAKDASNLRVMVVGATNRPDMLDAAILRPGRLDKHIYVPPPDKTARQAILSIYTSKMSCADIDIDHLSSVTDLYSGADLKNLCKEAGLQAMREHMAQPCRDDQMDIIVTNTHFDNALKVVKPSLTQKLLNEYKK